MPPRKPRSRWKLWALVAGVVLAVGLALWLTSGGFRLADFKAWVHDLARRSAQVNPLLFVLAFTVLPYVGVPSMVLYFAAGAAYGPARAIAWCAIGLLLNTALGYVIGAHWLREPLRRWMVRRGRNLPEVPRGEVGQLIVLTRILPGPPLVAQNLLLALAGVPFWKYLLYSWPLQMLFASGFILSSGALFHGKKGLMVFGVSFIVAMALLAHIVNAAYKTRKKRPPPD
jgi:uncharacterized membrane protein YdjX (TVP38/TMEM64 family)